MEQNRKKNKRGCSGFHFFLEARMENCAGKERPGPGPTPPPIFPRSGKSCPQRNGRSTSAAPLKNEGEPTGCKPLFHQLPPFFAEIDDSCRLRQLGFERVKQPQAFRFKGIFFFRRFESRVRRGRSVQGPVIGFRPVIKLFLQIVRQGKFIGIDRPHRGRVEMPENRPAIFGHQFQEKDLHEWVPPPRIIPREEPEIKIRKTAAPKVVYPSSPV